ncbi:MAG: VCBS repeat-containing protein, partial [Ignavibacteriales bacterium]|nr:VCBS repeat-containing protein [Ignavibacteriales bacterium]
MKPHKHRQSSPLQTLVSFLIVLQISSEFVLGAQRYLSTFGFVSELRTQKNSLGLIIGDFNGDDVSDLASFGGYQVRLFYQHPDSMSFKTSTLFTKRQIVAAASAILNRDKITDIILILDNPPAVAVYIGKKQGIFYLVSEKEISEIPENLIATDINADRKADLVFYGKKTLGADVYLGNGNGTFRDRIIFFPEYSFSSMALTNLHNIGATDIIASSWISNEVLIFSNYGKMKFSDPSVLSFSSEPVFVKCTHIDSDRALDLVVCTPDENKIYTYLGDGLGGFQQSQMLTFEFQPVGIRTGDTNSDGTDDLGILSLSTQSLHLLLNSGKGLFEEDIPFFGGMNPAQLEFYRHGKSSYINAAIIDTTNNRIRILFNASRTIRTDEELKFGVGVRPDGLVTTDINDDGWDDILIANSGSNNLSLLLNDGSGYFSGQISFSFTHSPTTLSYFSQNESTKIILSTSSSSNKISVMELNPKTFSHMLYHLPSHGESDILEISETEDLHHLAIYVFERYNNRKESNLIKFERIDGHRFTQRYYSLTPSFHPISACMGDCEGSQNKQLTFALYDMKQQKKQIFQSK